MAVPQLLLLALSGCVPECGLRERLTRVLVRQTADGLALFCKEQRRPPDRLAELAPPECEGARCVLKELRSDSWEHPLVLQKYPGRVEVLSVGADGQLGTSDDLVVSVPCGR